MTLVNLRRVTHAEFYWSTTTGQRKDEEPNYPTYLGDRITIERKEFLVSLGWSADYWQPVIHLHVSNGKTISFTGDEAVKLWESYKGVVFSGK